ncbi:TetR/AcrR family transcriptional regulator [Nocardia alni]|uniref:TetR/AcrR family transcriptional regulator n=1 Tax=Nocardia alni TaxID=2815723 RepID=UPI001C242F91|nr:TetR family transcriptional regulator [Nocardia alni]
MSSSTSPGPEVEVPAELVQAAVRAADQAGRQIADVPVVAIAAEAGISRSTLLRRLGGSRRALDEAARSAGIDPGGRPVKERALAAAAELISETGIGLATLDAIASRANCSVDSLFTIYGTRDELLAAVFERYSPIFDIEVVLAADRAEHADFPTTVRHVYRQLAHAFSREPRVTPALIAESLARPGSPAIRSVVRHNAPRLFGSIGRWLTEEIDAGRIRDLPIPLLLHQFAGPLSFHLMFRQVSAAAAEHHDTIPIDLPDLDQACDLFAETFLRAVAVEPNPQKQT